MLRLIWLGDVYFHMWFMYVLLAVYFAMPFVSRILLNDDVRLSQLGGVFLCFWLLQQSVVPLMSNLLQQITGYSFFPRLASYSPLFAGYSGFVCLGCVLGHVKLTRIRIWLAAAAIVVSLCTTSVAHLCRVSGVCPGFALLSSGDSPNAVLMCGAMFYMSRGIKTDSKAVGLVAASSFGIYLVHPLVMNGLVQTGILKHLSAPLYIPVRALLVMFLTFCVVTAMRRVPFLKHTV